MDIQRRRRVAVGCVSAVAVAAVVAATAGSGAAASPSTSPGAKPAPYVAGSPAGLVNPIIGTSGAVDTFPGPDRPFGMMQWSPDTSPDRPSGGGYEYNDTAIRGFSFTHISGPGCGVAGDVPILPYVGDTGSDPGSLTAPFSHTGEVAKVGYYQVTTGTGADAVKTELTTATHSGLARFTFPSGTASKLVLKLDGGASTVDGTSYTLIGGRELVGSVTSGHFCGQSSTLQNDYTLHFDLLFNQPFTAATPYGPGAHGPAGVVLTFDTTSKHPVLAKAGISYTSGIEAIANRATEIPAWNFGAVRAGSQSAWDNLLGRIEIAGRTRTQQIQFYTALYHALLHPNVFSDADGSYMGFDNKVHHTEAGHAQYANYSGWDIYRSQVQLAALVAPQQTSDSIRSMLNDYDQSGMLPKWASNNGESYVMVGDPADPIIADAYAFGARDFNTAHALSAMVHEATQANNIRPGQQTLDAKGYLPYDGQYRCCNFYGPVSTQLEYDTADYAIASFANSLGNHSVYATFAARAQNWQNTFNPASGYVQAKLGNGQWVAGFTPGTSTGMVEGTAAQYTPMVPFNLKTLIAAKGGDAAYVKYLDSLFTSIDNPSSTNADLSNEPSLEIPWEYNYAGAPWRTQEVVREAQQQLYFDKPVGQFGNDDLGAMSSWYVWSNLGLYPETPGSDVLTIGSPVFPLSVVHLANGRSLTITAPKAAPNAPYVQSLSVNGKAWNKTYLRSDSYLNGANLAFDLGTTPNRSWGTGPGAAPPSDGSGQQAAFASAGPASLVLQPGKTGTATLTVTNVSNHPVTVRWTADAQTGVSVTPISGKITAAAGATATARVRVSAAANAEGRYAVTFHFRMGFVGVPDSAISVAVAKRGEVWPFYTNAGITNDDNTDAATFDGGGWSYSAQALAAVGVTPGATLTSDGVTYTWPNVPVATLDNIEAAGQTIPLQVPSAATKIGFLGSSSNASSTGAGGEATVHYTDGTTSTFQAKFADWTLGAGSGQPVPGTKIVVTTPYRNASGNQRDNTKTYVFSLDAPLTPGKTVASVTLPNATGGDMHVFAIGFGGTTGASSQATAAVPRIAPAPRIGPPSPGSAGPARVPGARTHVGPSYVAPQTPCPTPHAGATDSRGEHLTCRAGADGKDRWLPGR